MKSIPVFILMGLCLGLGACFDNDHPPQGGGGLAAEVKAPLDKAASVNQTIDAQDTAQRKAMDEQGQ